MLTAFALIIFTVELQLPTLAPVPGMKLGLANIITVYAVYSFSAGETAMLLLRRVIDKKHIWVCSILGAVLHNIGQTAAAIVMMQTKTVIAYLPFLLVSGCIAGALTGMAAQLVVSRLNK